MKKYFVEDIRCPFEQPQEVMAQSPLEAVKKTFPNCKVSRDMNNSGNIVVGNWFNGYYGAVYKRYVYNIERK